MDLRVLRYFLTVAREKSIVKAAEALHVTQPTLSRQLRDLEDEFGARLFLRGSKTKGITLTEKGFLLRKRAEEIVELADRTQEEMNADDAEVGGDIMIGGGESDAMRLVARVVNTLQQQYPDIHYHLFSGNAEDVKERLDKGLLDFGVFIAPVDLTKYETLQLPAQDRWGLIVRKDSPFAKRAFIAPEELIGIPLWMSRQVLTADMFEAFAGLHPGALNVIGTYNLVFNAALMVSEGAGCLLSLDKLVDTGPDSDLCFVPLAPARSSDLFIAWKKYQILGKAAEAFLKGMRELCHK
ncbi:MAG: LysR family transcriptional regulator [Oscillospiraceae bacterium]|nr:LysR family transcriptional regulator [Oscillospiraceae bacterium]